MNWVKCLISSLGLLLLAQAALAADIHRFTDSQGTLHITNIGPKQRQSPVQPPGEAASPSVRPAEKSPPTAPAPEPALIASKPPVESPIAPAAQDAAGHLAEVEDATGAIQATPGPGGQEETGKVAANVKRIAWVLPQRGQVIPRGEIVCYADRHKVIRITNLPPEEALPEVQVKAAPAVQQQALPDALEPPAFQRISWQPPEMAGPPPRPLSNPGSGLILAENSIRRYRDSQGVWHITNEPAAEGAPHAAPVAATAGDRASPAQAHAPPVAPVPLPSAGQKQAWPPGVAPPAMKQASCAELGPEVVAYLQDKLRAASMGLAAQTIRRQRDSRGVWHIANEPAADAAPSPVLAAAAAGGVFPLPTPGPAVIRPVDLPGGPGLARGQPQAQGPTVIARRDRRGVLHVSTVDSSGFMQARSDPASFLTRVPPFLQGIIVEAARMHGLPVSLVLAIIRNESNFAPQAVSPKGAMGLMQLMPGTAASLGVGDPFAPRENVLAGCRYFRWLLDSFQGSVPLALAAYNAGHQRVISAGWQIPAIKETQDFVTQVMGLYYVLEKQAAAL